MHIELRDSEGRSQGVAIVHAADYELVNKRRWDLDKYTGYARRGDGQHMHRIVMGMGQKRKYQYKVVDRIDRNRVNNCRVCNLRICSAAENSRKRRANWQERKTSLYRGFSYKDGRKGRTLSKPWRACIRVEKTLIDLDYSPTEAIDAGPDVVAPRTTSRSASPAVAEAEALEFRQDGHAPPTCRGHVLPQPGYRRRCLLMCLWRCKMLCFNSLSASTGSPQR